MHRSFQQEIFVQVAASEQKREHFAKSVVDFLITHGFDGIDLDWVSNNLLWNEKCTHFMQYCLDVYLHTVLLQKCMFKLRYRSIQSHATDHQPIITTTLFCVRQYVRLLMKLVIPSGLLQ